MKRGRASTCIETIWTCPKCGETRTQWRKPSSFGKTLATYCGNCQKMYRVLLENHHSKRPMKTTYVYNLNFTARIDRAIPALSEMTESVNRFMCECGFGEKLQIRAPLFSFNLRCSGPLDPIQVQEAQSEILKKMQEQLPDLEVLSDGWILVYETEYTEEPAKTT